MEEGLGAGNEGAIVEQDGVVQHCVDFVFLALDWFQSLIGQSIITLVLGLRGCHLEHKEKLLRFTNAPIYVLEVADAR